MKPHRRKRVGPGLFEDRGALAAVVAIGSGPSKLQSEKRYPLTESRRVIQEWQRQERDRLRQQRPHVARGSFADDVLRYLLTLADRPELQHERAVQLRWWCELRGPDGRLFGDRRRHTFKPDELRAALAGLAKARGTIRHYRTALFHLYTTLDGKNASNPLRDVAPPRVDDPEPRYIPLEILDAILAAMPDHGRRHGRAGIAPAVKTKARLRVMVEIGLPHAQVMRLLADHVDWQEPSVLVLGRRKGKGAKTVRLPLTDRAVAALRQFFAVQAEGPFRTSHMHKAWWRAIHTMVDRLARTDYRAARSVLESLERLGARPYDTRHSFLTASYLAGKDLRVTQALAMHRSAQMTDRYTLAAVNPRLLDVIATLNLQRQPVPAIVPATSPERKSRSVENLE